MQEQSKEINSTLQIHKKALSLCGQLFPSWKNLTLQDVEVKDTSGLTNQTLLIRKLNCSHHTTNYFVTGNPMHCDQQYPPFTKNPHTNFFIQRNDKNNFINSPAEPNSSLTNASQVYQNIKLAGYPFTNPPSFPQNPTGLCIRFFNNPLTKYNIGAEHAFFQTLSDHGIGPRCYFQNDDYRIEQLIESRNTTLFEMRNSWVLQSAIRQVCDLHNNLELGANLRKATNGGKPFLDWDSMLEKWIKPYQKVKEKIKNTPSARAVYREAVNKFQFVLQSKFQQFFESLLPENAKMVPSHNDIQQCNMLMHKSDLRRITIIDFDYVGYNYRSFDLAGYINECELDNNSGCDFPFIAWYSQNRMTKDEQKRLVEIYIRREWEIKKARNDHQYNLRVKQKIAELKDKRQEVQPDWEPPINWNPWQDEWVNKDNIEAMPKVYDTVQSYEDYREKQFLSLWEEVQEMKTLQHLYWGIWAIATAPLDKLDEPLFNFHYALGRLDRFNSSKKK